MPFAAVGATVASALPAIGAAASVAGTVASLAGGSSASGDISQGVEKSGQLAQQAIGYDQPFYDTGVAANTRLNDLLNLNGPDASANALADFHTSPGYDFAVSQGLRAVDAGAASRGLLRSGNTITAEQTLGNNLANQEFGNYYNRLAGISGQGLQASSLIGGALTGQQQTIASGAASQANLAQNMGNTLGNGITSLANNGALNSLFSNDANSSYQNNPTNNALLAQVEQPANYGPAQYNAGVGY